MGYHCCELCKEPTWGSKDHCPNSSNQGASKVNGTCNYGDRNNLCYTCTVFLVCERCGLAGCDHCVQHHCGQCDARICGACDDYDNKDEGEDNVNFPLCGHISCNRFVKVGAVLDNCRPCKTANNLREQQRKLAIQKQLENDDAIILKTVQSQLKSESLKKTHSDWFAACEIPEHETDDAAENTKKKVNVEK